VTKESSNEQVLLNAERISQLQQNDISFKHELEKTKKSIQTLTIECLKNNSKNSQRIDELDLQLKTVVQSSEENFAQQYKR
jgi:hypothetical protein